MFNIRNKKGQVTQVLTFMLVIFVIGLTIMLGKLIMSEFYAAVESENTEAMSTAQASIEAQYATFDYGLVALSVIMIIGLLITSFLIPTHPIFFVINIVGIFFLVFIGMILTNVYGEMVAGQTGIDTGLDEVANDYNKTNFLLSNLPYIGAVVLAIVSIVQFSKGRGSGY